MRESKERPCIKSENSNLKEWCSDTLALHAGFRSDPATNATIPPVYLSNAYAFTSVEHAADVFDLREEGRTYSRLMNPTTDIFEQRVAAIEGGVSSVATSSGQAAIMLSILNIAQAGDNIVSSTDLYGGSINLLSKTFERLGIQTRFVDPSNPQNFADCTDAYTKCWFAEALPNPKLKAIPLRAIAEKSKDVGVPLIVDNTLTPLIARPFDLGASIIVHSTSKYICGHGTTIGGCVIDSGRFDWASHSDRFPLMVLPDESHGNIEWLKAANQLKGQYATSPYLLKLRNTLMRDFGPCPSPLSSHHLLLGLETLTLRMEKHCQNAHQVARFLSQHEMIEEVIYPSLGSENERRLSRDLMGPYGGPMVVFDLADGLSAGKRFIENLQLIHHVSNIGDARTLATHPASTTHASLPREARIAAGVFDGTIRLSVGIENISDIIDDLKQALENVV